MLQGKLLFTLSEARVMTGLSRQILMEAIKEGRLHSQIVGKAYRIKAKDLEKFIIVCRRQKCIFSQKNCHLVKTLR